MVVVVVIGLLAAFAIPALSRVTKKSNATTVVNNLRQFSAAIEAYNSESGGWPPDTAEQVVPPGLTDRIKAVNWVTPIAGGHVYDWDLNVSGVTAAISLRPFGGNNADPIFLEIDRALDDANPATGMFRLVGDRYMYILQN